MARFTSIIEEENKRGQFSRWNTTPPPGYVCRKCNQPGHFIHDCPAPDRKVGSSPSEGYVCRICNEAGHWIQDCPMKNRKKATPEGYVCKICSEPGHWIQDCPQKSIKPRPGGGGGACWFCLSSPEVASHLVVSVGEEVYLALPKGPLCAGHCLLLPISHVPNQGALGSGAAAELTQFRGALTKFFASQGKKVVFWERNVPVPQQHLTIEAVPLTATQFNQAKQTLLSEADALGLECIDIPSASLRERTTGQSYLSIDVGENSLVFFVTESNRRGLLNFARSTMAALLGSPGRADWRECQSDVSTETSNTQTFQTAFAPFDPTE